MNPFFSMSKSKIEASQFVEYAKREGKIPDINFPSTYLLIYQPFLAKEIEKNYPFKKYHLLGFTLYFLLEEYLGIGIVIIPGIGAPAAAVVFEELVALGGKEFISLGFAGAIDRELSHGNLILCEASLIEEGTSYHYAKYTSSEEGEYSYPTEKLFNLFKEYLKESKTRFIPCKGWTTDAIYRESLEKVNSYPKRGIKIVDMETSALFTISKVLKVEFCSFFVVSDLLYKEVWEPYFTNSSSKNGLVSGLKVIINFFNRYKNNQL